MPAIAMQTMEPRFRYRITKLSTFCKRVAGLAWHSHEPAEVSIVLATDDFVHDLNKRYRGKDCPTNVLSFENPQCPPENELWLAGDIVMAYETILSEAKAQDKTFEAHFAHLLVHGLLHLQGYDHLTESDAVKMEALETLLMKKMGYDDPYRDVV